MSLALTRSSAMGALMLMLAGLVFLDGVSSRVRGQEEAQAATGPPIYVAVLLSSNRTVCHERGYVKSIRKLADRQAAKINARGGVRGRRLELLFLDDERDPDRTIENVGSALAERELLAIIGLTSSDHAEKLFERLGDTIKGSGVPFIADNSVSEVFQHLPNVYSTRPSQSGPGGRGPAVAAFMKERGYQSVGLLVNQDRLYSRTVGDSVAEVLGGETIVSDQRVGMTDDDVLKSDDVDRAVADLAAKNPQSILLVVGSTRSGVIIQKLQENGATSVIFLIGTMSRISDDILDAYPAPILELTWTDLPDVFNANLGALIAEGQPEDWIFEGAKIPEAKKWEQGKCVARSETDERNPLETDNVRAILRGMQFADMIALVARGANQAAANDIASRRKSVLDRLSGSFASGSGTFRGPFNNWSFDKETRVAVRPMFIVMRPPTIKRRQLAPLQFVRLRDNSLRRMDTLYLDVDLIKAHRVDDNEKTFFAEFYLAMRANEGASIDRLEFSNAYINPRGAGSASGAFAARRSDGRHLTIQELHDGSEDRAFPDQMKIYRVAGRFMYSPQLQNYPFDKQRFSIDIQPRSGAQPFVIQPPPAELRDTDVESDDWQLLEQYVGISEDFVPMVDAYRLEPSVVPFYRASFVWVMKREVTDYFLRVVVPLAFILIVAYVSIFIPQANFEAIVTIQVTALLSAVALYLSLPQLDSDTATLSDRIFLFDYMMVSLMIILSILRINRLVAGNRWLKGMLGFVHIAGIPLLVGMMFVYVYDLSQTTPP